MLPPRKVESTWTKMAGALELFWVLLSKDSCPTESGGLNGNGNCDELDGNGEIDCNGDGNGGVDGVDKGNGD